MTNKTIDCPACKGQGFFPGKIPPKKCNLCLGTGYLNKPTPNPQETVDLTEELLCGVVDSLNSTTGGQIGAAAVNAAKETIHGIYRRSQAIAEPHVVQTPPVPQKSSPGFEEVLRIFIANLSVTRRPREGDPIFSDVLAAHQKEIQVAKREAYNDVWQGFKQQYTGTKWEQEMEPWLRSFVVMANITSKHLGESE